MADSVIVVAELGVSHNGSLETALKMVDAAADAGCDAVKVQMFQAEEFCAPSAMYKGERQVDLFKRYEFGPDDFKAIAARAHARGLRTIATITSIETLGWALNLETLLWAYKIGSDDITNLDLLRAFASETALKLQRTILSTGMATAREIECAVELVRPEYVLHCTSVYPCPDRAVNLWRIEGIRVIAETCDHGFSDHTVGHEASIAAVARGAHMIEKHLTLDRIQAGPDHAFSETPESMAELVKSIRRVEAMMGDGLVDPQPEETRMRYTARRFAVAARSMVCGTRLEAGDILAKRCAADHLCFEPPEFPALVGRVLNRALVEGEPIRVGDLE